MQRCPQCYQIYEDHEKYCEIDGQRLLPDPLLYLDAEESLEEVNVKADQFYTSWTTALIGVLSGIIICVGCYAIYSIWTLQVNAPPSDPPPYVSRLSDTVPTTSPTSVRRPEAAPSMSDSPSPEPEPLAEAAPAPPDPAANRVKAILNQGPVSTGAKRDLEAHEVQTLIEMNDGSTVEVDAAWRDDQGVWYRRGGLVSFVESRRVKTITAKAEVKPSPASVQ